MTTNLLLYLYKAISNTIQQIILYSNNCPRCKILKKKLDDNKINYEIIDNVDTMIDKGLSTVPVLEINGRMLDFKEAVEWVNNS